MWFLIIWFGCGLISFIISLKLILDNTDRVTIKDAGNLFMMFMTGCISLLIFIMLYIVFFFKEHEFDEIVIYKRKEKK
jgi:uncharacterized membrane protein